MPSYSDDEEFDEDDDMDQDGQEEDDQFDDDDDESEDGGYANGGGGGGGGDGEFAQRASDAMKSLKDTIGKSDWKRVLKHKKSGVQVYSRPGPLPGPLKPIGKKAKKDNTPIYKGEGIIEDFSPQEVFAVIGTRKLWDDWYEEGNLVDNLNDTTSMTYMVMKGIPGSSARDLSLVEQIECTQDGAIYFVSTSVETPRVPKVSGRTRAVIKLNGWYLEAKGSGTRVVYILQTDVKTPTPGMLLKVYMARRPLVIVPIADYLKKNGPPPIPGADPSGPGKGRPQSTRSGKSGARMSRRQSRSNLRDDDEEFPSRNGKKGLAAAGAGAAGAAAGGAAMAKRRGSTASKGGAGGGGGGGAPFHVPKTTDTKHASANKKGLSIVSGIIKDNNGWSKHPTFSGETFLEKENPDSGLPITKGASTISGLTTEEVHAIVTSMDARKIWDDRCLEASVIERINGHDQYIARFTQSGVFPIEGRDYVVSSVTERADDDLDNSRITVAMKSVEASGAPSSKKMVRGTIEGAGWLLEPDKQGVNAIFVSKSDVKMQEIPIAAERIWTYTLGEMPGAVARFAETYGFPPFWHRWSGGTIVKESVDIKSGEASWTVKPGKEGQVCWLHWSETMYPDGIELSIEPSDAVKVGALNNRNESAQFTFNNTEEVTINLSPGNGRGAGDVSVDGKPASKVKGGSGAVAGGAAAGAAAGAAGGAAMAGRSKSKKNGKTPPTPEEDEEDDEPQPPPKAAAAAGATRGSKPGRRSEKEMQKEEAPATSAPAAQASAGPKSGSSDFIALNDSLKFSAGQVATLVGLAGLAYALGKLSVS